MLAQNGTTERRVQNKRIEKTKVLRGAQRRYVVGGASKQASKQQWSSGRTMIRYWIFSLKSVCIGY